MRKIYTKSVFEFNPKTDKFEVNENESQFHYIDDDAPVAQMKSGGSGNQVTVQNTAPWADQQTYLRQGFEGAKYLSTIPMSYYPGNTVVPFSPETEESLGMITNRARNGSPTFQGAEGLLNRTINGDYLTGGKGFDAALEAAKNKIIPDVSSRFAKSGRYGSGLNQTAEATAIGDSFAGLYNNERERQQQAMQLAPEFANEPYRNAQQLSNVGLRREDLEAQKIQDLMDRYNFSSNERRNSLKDYLGMISGNYGSQFSQTTPNAGATGWRRYLLGTLGGAGAGFKASGGSPWGAGAGGIAGLLDSM